MAKGIIESDIIKQNLEVFERVIKEVRDRRASSGIFLPSTIPAIIHESMIYVARANGVDATVVISNCTDKIKVSTEELNELLSDYIYDMSHAYEKRLMKRCGRKDDPEAIQARLHEIKGSSNAEFRY
ncbi:MAG: hypothetical protein LBN02_07520 [Oscillospiraceae bacterium]|jgi:hypothetical protein|nr:hypothetical protein [Oscillospiraceae bacterium]